MAGGLQVLADGDHLATRPGQIPQHLLHLLPGLSQSHHEPRLDHHLAACLPGPGQQLQGTAEVGLRANPPVKARHRLQVVIEHVRLFRQYRLQRRPLTGEVRYQQLDRDSGIAGTDLVQAADEVAGTAVGQVVAGDRGDHHVADTQLADRFGHPPGFVGVRRGGPAVADGTEAAVAAAGVAQHQEGGRVPAEAIAHVGAAGFLAHGMQLGPPQHHFHGVAL